MSLKEEIPCEDYNGYYLVDEQCIRINRPNSANHDFVQTILANNSIWYVELVLSFFQHRLCCMFQENSISMGRELFAVYNAQFNDISMDRSVRICSRVCCFWKKRIQ